VTADRRYRYRCAHADAHEVVTETRIPASPTIRRRLGISVSLLCQKIGTRGHRCGFPMSLVSIEILTPLRPLPCPPKI
jgi:hypothetical protein